jgi:predicted nucleic acid-binding protein
MGLQSEFQQDLDQATSHLGDKAEALLGGQDDVEVELDDAMSFLLSRQVALEAAVMKLAALHDAGK